MNHFIQTDTSNKFSSLFSLIIPHSIVSGSVLNCTKPITELFKYTYPICAMLAQFGSVPAQFGSVHLPKVYQLTTVWFSSSTVWFCSPTQGVPTYHSLVQFQPDLGSITNNQLQLHFQLRLLSEVNYNYTVLISQFNYNYNYNYNSMCYCNSMGGVYQSVCTGGKFKFFLSKRGVN